MKTVFKKLLTVALTGVLVLGTTLTTVAAEMIPAGMLYTYNEQIRKVQVSGNVRVFLIQGKSDWVSVDDLADLPKVSVTQRGGLLMISSSEKEPVSVMVHVKNIFRIEASGTARVSTVGTFTGPALQVILKDEAYARVKVNTGSLYTLMKDKSKLVLLGKTGDHIVNTQGLASLKATKFNALKSEDENIQLALNRDTMIRTAEAKQRTDSLKARH